MTKKLMKVEEFPDSVWYRVSCSCSDQEHDVDIWFEGEDHLVTMTMWTTVTSSPYSNFHDAWYKQVWDSIWWRVKTVFSIVFRGRVKYNGEFVLDEDNIEAFKKAIDKAKDKLSEQQG